MRATSQDVVFLGQRRRARLEGLVRRATTPQRMVLRARIVLAAWRGHATAQIARDLGISVDTARRWRRRFCREGCLAWVTGLGRAGLRCTAWTRSCWSSRR